MNEIRINEQIAFLRHRKGVTQEVLAKQLGVTNRISSCCRRSRISSGSLWMSCWGIPRKAGWTPCA